ncbi:eukaryotic translation initiation factor 3 subunit a, partial [Trifolium pratense]
ASERVMSYASQEVQDIYYRLEQAFLPSDLALKVSNVFQTMKVGNLAGMMLFFDFSIVEKISVDAVKHKFLTMKVDHRKTVVIFCKKGDSYECVLCYGQ